MILAGIDAFQQLKFPVVFAHSGVVAGRDHGCAERNRMLEKRLELDFRIAQHVRIRRSTGRIFAQKFREHAILVFGGKIDGLEVDADHVGGGGGVDKILAGRTIFIIVIVFPVLHEQADHVETLLF